MATTKAPVTIIQYETRANPRRRALMEENRRYAHKHGYEYLNISNISDLPPQWMKVNLALLVMRSGMGDGGLVVWLDSDAVIVDKSRRVEDVFSSLAGSEGVFLASGASGLFGRGNADCGVFIVRACDAGRALLEDWMDQYSPKNWIYPGRSGALPGAGSGWRLSVASGTEKDLPAGTFAEAIYQRYKKHIRLVEEDVFNCVTPNFSDVQARVFACHFHGPYQSRIQDYLLSHGSGHSYERPVAAGEGWSWRTAGLVLAGAAIGGALIWATQAKVERGSPFLTAARNLSEQFRRVAS
jgi:hypothetical protein